MGFKPDTPLLRRGDITRHSQTMADFSLNNSFASRTARSASRGGFRDTIRKNLYLSSHRSLAEPKYRECLRGFCHPMVPALSQSLLKQRACRAVRQRLSTALRPAAAKTFRNGTVGHHLLNSYSGAARD